MRKKHSIESVRVFFLQILNIPFRETFPSAKSEEKRMFSQAISRTDIASITQIVNIGGHLVFWDVVQLFFSPSRIFKNTYRTCLFFLFSFFSCIQLTQKSDYGRKRRGKIERAGKREEGKRVPLLLSYTGSILGTFLNGKNTAKKNWLFWP